MLQGLGVREKCKIGGKAGLAIGPLPATRENVFVDSSIRGRFAELDAERKLRVLPVLAEQLIAASRETAGEVVHLLEQHGFEYTHGEFVPTGLLDEREAHHLPTNSASELAKAVSRLAASEESAAITSACGAVDLATSAARTRGTV